MSGTPRVLRPNRAQLELRPTDLESLLPEDHRARAVWEFVCGLDLSPWYEAIRSVEGEAGRPAIDPAILLSLWIYATLEGVGSARAVARLCEQHDAYRWICGGVAVSYRTLAAFRVMHEAKLDALLTESVVQRVDAGLVCLDRIAQDGMRVRASAGAASFRRCTRLRELEREVQQRIAALRRELEDDPAAASRRAKASREQVARDRSSRVKKALAKVRELGREKPAEQETVRASTTDPAARVMKMADGGFTALHAIDAAHAQGCRVYAPPMKPRDSERNPHRPRPGDSEAVARWRRRMGTPSAKEKYKDRAVTAECVNAQARNRGLQRLLVRGRDKARAVLLLYALAHNAMRSLALKRTLTEAAA